MPGQSCGCDPTWEGQIKLNDGTPEGTLYRGWLCALHLKEMTELMTDHKAKGSKRHPEFGRFNPAIGGDGIDRGPSGKPGGNINIGIGGAPTRATTLPDEPAARKQFPVASGFMDYFPDAIAAVSNVSWRGNEQHNPGQPMHWARGKSMDESDTMMRHFLQRGTLDTDGTRHSAKMVWRALAILQKEIEGESR